MQLINNKLIEQLWKLTGEIGTKAETNSKYEEVYIKLSEALDIAEQNNLIQYRQEGLNHVPKSTDN